MADTDIVFGSLYQFAGRLVDVVICGLDCGSYQVSQDGLATVTVPRQSDPDGLLTGEYIATFDVGPYDRTTYGDATTQLSVSDTFALQTVYVPVTIGFSFTHAGQLLRPATEAQTKSPEGPALGKTRRIHRYAALFRNTIGISIGTVLANLFPVDFRNAGGSAPLTKNILFSGVIEDTIDSEYSFDGQITWMGTRPYPCTIASISGFVETQER